MNDFIFALAGPTRTTKDQPSRTQQRFHDVSLLKVFDVFEAIPYGAASRKFNRGRKVFRGRIPDPRHAVPPAVRQILNCQKPLHGIETWLRNLQSAGGAGRC
jgi:hypothetical protein